jgi:hypothetical protein
MLRRVVGSERENLLCFCVAASLRCSRDDTKSEVKGAFYDSHGYRRVRLAL